MKPPAASPVLDTAASLGSRLLQKLTVDHRTHYRYARPMKFGEHRLMIRPRDSHDLRLLDATLLVQPHAHVRWLYDVFGNSVAIAEFDEKADELLVHSTIVIERYPFDEPVFPIEPYAWTLPFSYPAREVPDLGRTVERHYPDPDRQVIAWAQKFLDGDGSTVTEDFLLGVTRAIQGEFIYQERETPGVQSPLETLTLGSGTCRDYAVLMMEVVRSVGLAARFVTGYLYDPSIDGGGSATVGAGATHAWVQVYLPGAGWVEFDPTNGSYGGNNLVPIAVGREPEQAMPVSGTFVGDPADYLGMTVSVNVTAEHSPGE
jgi:transglutaminase-like putative cysteine protease